MSTTKDEFAKALERLQGRDREALAALVLWPAEEVCRIAVRTRQRRRWASATEIAEGDSKSRL